MSKSKFAGLLHAAQNREAEPEERAPDTPPSVPLSVPKRDRSAAGPEAGEPESTGPRRRGRPPVGKRSNPDYEQVSVYLRRDTHTAAKIRLLQAGTGQDVSELVQELLSAWLAAGPDR